MGATEASGPSQGLPATPCVTVPRAGKSGEPGVWGDQVRVGSEVMRVLRAPVHICALGAPSALAMQPQGTERSIPEGWASGLLHFSVLGHLQGDQIALCIGRGLAATLISRQCQLSPTPGPAAAASGRTSVTPSLTPSQGHSWLFNETPAT